MIPDKIYIRHYWMPGELDDEWRLKPVEDEKCEEYIRKDYLLEWLEEELRNGGPTTLVQHVINRIKTL